MNNKCQIIGLVCFWLLALFSFVPTAQAIEPVVISSQNTAIDLSQSVEIHHSNNNSFQTSTAPGSDGIVRRIEVQGNSDHGQSDWAVFSISNPTDEQIDRLIVAPHYRMVGSGLLWPDLGSIRIQSITPSEGFALDRQSSPDSDVFRITINPGAVITFVAELGSPNLPQINLWEPDAYKDTINAYTLYHGILLGISGLLALLLSILFVVRGTTLFPATAAVAWAVLFYIGIDFNFLSKLFTIAPGSEPIWRAATEVALAASLFVFLFTYLHLNRWHYHFSYGAAAWFIALCGLGAFAIYDPTRAAGIARLSFGLTALIGIILIGYLSIRGYDRAIMLIPTWLLLIFWICGAYVCIMGELNNDIAQPALAGGLVLIVLLIAFTVMQHAFSGGAFQQGLFSDLERRALAVMGAGDVVWDWDIRRDRVVINPDLSMYLGSAAHQLNGTIRNWVTLLHSDDRDQFRTILDTILDTRKGRIDQNFRLRSGDGHYHWFSLRARPVIGTDNEIVRIVGTLSNITDHKKAEERLLQDSIHDNLTGLPNQQLFLDRLQNYVNMAISAKKIRPTVFVIDFDGFRDINHRFGMSVGDTFLLTIARRLGRLIKPQDTLSRLSADRFAIVLTSQTNTAAIAAFADLLKKTVAAPILFSQREIKLAASIGLLTWTEGSSNAEDILNDAELAMVHAKQAGGNRIEPFRPNYRALGLERNSISNDIRYALQRKEIKVLYHPILDLADGQIVGFEAILEWHHPRHGNLSTADFMTAAESENMILPIARHAMTKVIEDLTEIQVRFPKQSFFVSVNLPSAQMLHQDFVNEMRSILSRNPINKGWLMLEMSEAILIEKPEHSSNLLEKIKSMGINLALDNFGTGYSSLAFLVRYPFDIIKLDRSLLTVDTTKKNVVLKSIISMAHDLNLKVIAEGVETEHEAMLLREEGCEYVQSVVFSDPVEIDDLITLVTKHPKANI
ncbi:EAL domain-containing protein [Bartonella tamiae]|uniref:Diguanylate cyclase (GGDEF) domain-containing protein n=1 Tax=Bartonella tamiae Th239 TaxID=1094558 RepID=J0ZPL5_9HYPH|nr:EAL domain-containing protein [Bartonella tamiae]EJF90528.1 diguanylate cyclase (GGDEF) domain-containing protein [Bartonella tamiae Th239]EJF93528.1 diguanylate cyclase (GGDEF) domain-containing protein [Bartonella tamiae Th307]